MFGDYVALEYIEKIYSDVSAKTLSRISKAFENIIQKLEGEIEIRRRPVFIGEDGGRVESALAGAKPNIGNVIQIYDAFFSEAPGDDKNLNQRGSVILHELAHLAGLNSDAEVESINSCEALRNFVLLVCGIADEEDLSTLNSFHSDSDGEDENSSPSGLSDKELEGAGGERPYDPDQPRDELAKWTSGTLGATLVSAAKKLGKKNDASKAPNVKTNESGYKGDDNRPVEESGMFKPDKEKDPIEFKKFCEDMDFNPDGAGEKWAGVKNPIDALYVYDIRKEAFDITGQEFKGQRAHNNHVDAFRHAYFNYRLAEKIGASEAKKFADGHEITDKNHPSETAMDLVNNKIGRELYEKHKTKGKEAAKRVIMEALNKGLLRTIPYDIKNN